ncbi:hypothetical protein VTK56DRAFT_6052 [Thermocarpiscus australiensis]
MSQYPHSYGYGQYYGQHPPQPYAYQGVSGYPAPPYNPPFNSPSAHVNRGISQASFNYNATHIPGLGIPGAAPAGGPYNLASGPNPWAQQHISSTSASTAPSQHVSTGTAFNAPRSDSSQPGPTVSDQSTDANASKHPAPVASRSAANSDMEEGELSEGQFEDLYEPRESIPDAAARPVSKPPPIADPSQPTSAAETPDAGFYATDEEGGSKGSKDNAGRERSASYSPFLSPREIQSEVPTPQPVADKRHASRAQTASSHAAESAPNAAVPGLQLTSRPPANEPTGNDAGQPGMASSQSPKDFLSSFKSLQEAKKEAQKAILRLWPLGVKYQNYIDEGFDEKFIKGLFRDLHLDVPQTAPGSPASRPQEAQPRQGAASASTKPGEFTDVQSQQSGPNTKDSSAMPDRSGKGEERKDRIARLLAAKAAKALTGPKPRPAATQDKQDKAETRSQDTTPAMSNSSAPKSKTWGEKERLIQQKLAALQKAREAQAQKSASDKSDSGGASAPSSSGTPGLPKQAGGSSAVSIPAGPAANLTQQASIQPDRPQPSPAVPGLLMSSNAQLKPPSLRKRPVASDFVDYASAQGPLKRPFGQAHRETSLIINVSDKSDDEDVEMDMDMGSPVDESSPIKSSGILPLRKPSIRDFPPLTDTISPRRVSSPVPPQTPPGGPTNNRRRETELDLKEKAIQEMRRKIALAEARRKARQSSGGSVTPKAATQTPEPKDNETSRLPTAARTESISTPDHSDRPSLHLTPEASSAKFPKPSETPRLDSQERAERRGRIVSLDLPRVDSSLEEKLNRLRQLRDEEARLQAEIDRSMAEKKMLTEELEQLENAPLGEIPQPNGLGSGNDSEISVAQTGRNSVDNETSGSSLIPSTLEGSAETGIASADEATSSREQPHVVSPSDVLNRSGADAASSAADTGVAQSGVHDSTSTAVSESANAAGMSSTSDSLDSGGNNEPPLPRGDANEQEDGVKALDTAPASDAAPAAVLNAREQADAAMTDETTPMELDARSPSQEAAEPVSSVNVDDEADSTRQHSAPLPDRISRAAQPREEVQEIEAETAGEVHSEPASPSGNTLMPYESPLRYFHAYRFHADYHRTVAGGLKSLTYSNRIDPHKELCPRELTGEQCPADCEFQHFSSIIPPDDQILVELGNPDDYSGEEKSRFILGLRELLQKFKANKVKDFNTIARGIIEFRSQLLGDKSKVLHLEGVTI